MLVSSGLFLPLNSMSILLYKSSHEVLSVDIFSSGGWGHELVDESASLTFYLSCDSHAHLFKKVPCKSTFLGGATNEPLTLVLACTPSDG